MAATQSATASDLWLLASDFLPLTFDFWPLRICGASPWKPARIFPWSPTNIIPSGSNSRSSNSSGVGGFIEPSYQKRSKGGLLPLAANLKRIVQAAGKE